MTVTDEQVAALRSYLQGDPAEYLPAHQNLIDTGGAEGYGVLVYAAFVQAVRRTYGPTYDPADIIHFVADLRAFLSDLPDLIHPRAAENLIRRALGDPVTDDLDEETKARTQLVLLTVLAADAQLDGAALEEFLNTARTTANRWQAEPASTGPRKETGR